MTRDRHDDDVVFSVPFVAYQPRPRMVARPRPRMYEERRDKLEKNAIAAAYAKAGGGVFEGPVRVEVAVIEPLPKSRPRSVLAEEFTVKPDADNIAKKVLDALNGVAYADDSHVTELVVTKLPRLRGADCETHVLVGRAERREI
jgi:Holliday junction resolvase RusA-like endonuclease